jgi:hypothetical protein
MRIKNRLKEILVELGIKTMVPTDQVLAKKLGGMSLIRFNKLLNNAGRDIKVDEVQHLTTWLSELSGKPKADFQLLAEEEVSA